MLPTLKKTPKKMPPSAKRDLIDRVMQNAGQGMLFDRERNGKRVTISTPTQPIKYYTYAEKDEAELIDAALNEDTNSISPIEMTFPALYHDGKDTYEIDATATITKGNHYVFGVKVDKIHGRV
jgi:hypothetical protein